MATPKRRLLLRQDSWFS